MKANKMHLYMTGFGPFRNITENPSATIGKTVAQQLGKDGELSVEYEELGVNLDAVSAYFTKLEGAISERMNNDPVERVLLVHIGVQSMEEEGRLRLEVCGYNELEGFPITESTPMDASLESVFVREGSSAAEATAALVERLNSAIATAERDDEGRQRPHWLISRDAGRYYCNYSLYRALQLQKRWGGRVFAVFVHVANPLVCNNPSLAEQTSQVESLVSGLVQIAVSEL
ncbi:pyroglutamyl-peptidase I (PGP) [Trypanosoma grayi]|uniref:pyroglutamyl-peptidase I (PGP) n=1 Tax=Trypanosoma grayi TaxID=71804 RepID=UPI0004F4B929|nr:pyroglutamyl-peptidase I (PGP) [Trypanosoma grayi]KEG12528.1 pyroglutamyl-peptidase I (PGP) [Trypanosoma grayi]